mgnify:CR=1 FL=1
MELAYENIEQQGVLDGGSRCAQIFAHFNKYATIFEVGEHSEVGALEITTFSHCFTSREQRAIPSA